MTSADILKLAMSDCNMTQSRLGKILGKSVKVMWRYTHLRTDVDEWRDMLAAMGYEVIVRKARGGVMEDGAYKVDGREYAPFHVPEDTVLYNNIRYLMGDMGVSELSRRLGVTRQCVYHYLESTTLEPITVKKIAKAIGCNAKDIISPVSMEKNKRKAVNKTINLMGLEDDE